jgi:hypothetical protein
MFLLKNIKKSGHLFDKTEKYKKIATSKKILIKIITKE